MDRERTLPHDLDAERAILGACLVNGDLVPSVSVILGPDDFYRDAHGRIFAALDRLAQRGDPIDPLTVRSELVSQNAPEAVGGSAFVAGLMDGVPRVTSVAHWARMVKDCARRRFMIFEANRLVCNAYDGEGTVAELADGFRSKLDGLTGTGPGLLSMETVIKAAVADLERGPDAGLPWGLVGVDQATTGLQPGELVTVGARTSLGKSALVAQVALRTAMAGRHVLAFTLEMPPKSVGVRMLLQNGDVSRWRLGAGGDVGREAWAKVTASAGRLSGLPIEWDEAQAPTLGHILARAREVSRRGDLALVVVDYFQRIAIPSSKNEPRWAALGTVARGLKGLAMELDVPVLLAAQLNREAEGRRPTLADLRECGDLEQESDVVLLIHRPRESDDQVVETQMLVEKNRNGPRKSVTVGFHQRRFEFVDFEEEEGAA